MKTYSIFLILLMPWIFYACGKSTAQNQMVTTVEAINVKIIPIKKQSVSQTISASGQFTTNDETILSFKTGGIIDQIFVKEGEFVRKNQLLARLDLTEIQATVEQAELSYEKAVRDYERASNLYKDSVVTLEQYQNAQTALDVASKMLTASRFNLEYSEIRALNDGYVLSKYVNTGQMVNAGTPVLQTNGAGKSHWILKTGVSDKHWSMIAVGDEAIIATDAYPNQSIEAEVVRKSSGADPVNGSFSVELLVKGNNLSLASGMFGSAVVYPSSRTDLWELPYEALLDGNANDGFVFVTNDEETAEKIPVSISSIAHDRLYVDKGLEEAKFLIVSGSAYLSDHSAINIIE